MYMSLVTRMTVYLNMRINIKRLLERQAEQWSVFGSVK